MTTILEVDGLRVRLPTPDGPVTVVDGVDYRIQPGEVFGIAGESGSGKTMSVLALMGLLPQGATDLVRVGPDAVEVPSTGVVPVPGTDLDAVVFEDSWPDGEDLAQVWRGAGGLCLRGSDAG